MEARAEARAAAKAAGTTPRTQFPAPEVRPHSGDGLMKTRESNRKKLAETEKRDAQGAGRRLIVRFARRKRICASGEVHRPRSRRRICG
jgi:hypothetical protein